MYIVHILYVNTVRQASDVEFGDGRRQPKPTPIPIYNSPAWLLILDALAFTTSERIQNWSLMLSRTIAARAANTAGRRSLAMAQQPNVPLARAVRRNLQSGPRLSCFETDSRSSFPQKPPPSRNFPTMNLMMSSLIANMAYGPLCLTVRKSSTR